jgi:phosphoribosylformylglycinamidine synthase
VIADDPVELTRPSTSDGLRSEILRMAGSPNLSSRRWVTEQYDRYVRGGTVLAQPSDSGMIRIDESTGRGVALSCDCNGRYTYLDPYAGAQLALAEAYRNVAVSGARPIAVTNCLNFGSPEDPGVMWQFEQAVRGLADGCVALGIPVTGGNVSFYNQTGTTAILPTPVVGVLGVIDDVAARIPTGLGAEGDTLILLGETHDELGGSEWAHVVHNHLGGRPPKVDLAREQVIASVLGAGVSAAHDLSEGGLAQTLVESCLLTGRGCDVELTGDPFVALFSESSARVLVSVANPDEFTARCDEAGLPWQRLGAVSATSALRIEGIGELALTELREVWEGTLPALFG